MDVSPTLPSRRDALLQMGALASLGLGAGCSGVATTPSISFTAWSEAFAADWVRLSAERVTSTQYFDADEQAAYDRELTPLTPARRERRLALARGGLEQLARYPDTTLAPDERVAAAILRWSLQNTLNAAPYDEHDFVFNQLAGSPHLRYVSLLAENQPLSKTADLGAFLSRLSQVDLRLDEAIARCREDSARGLLPPRFILERSRAQVSAFLAQPPAEGDIVAGLVRRSAGMAGVTAEDRQRAIAEATALVRQRLLPAYQRVLALLNDLHPRTTDDAGLWRLPGGDAAYAQRLAGATTTQLSAEDIHALGLREVDRIEAEMDRVLRSLGRNQGSVEQRLIALRAELQPPANPDPRPAILARYADAIRDAQRRAQDLFNLQPRAPVEVRRVPALTERTASAFYTTPAPDGSRPGVFWAPLPGPGYDLLRIRSLAVHEAVPGHHFQLALQQEQTALPRWRQRRIFGGGSAHAEGWALYAERLALDHGWYDGDPHALLGGLDGQLFRARRLVVDTGLHAKRWTRERAIAYGLPAHEVERYVSNPGQACAYMVGMLHILQVRDEAQRVMGARFSLKAFHDVVLQTGSVPLDVLGSVVRRWAVA